MSGSALRCEPDLLLLQLGEQRAGFVVGGFVGVIGRAVAGGEVGGLPGRARARWLCRRGRGRAWRVPGGRPRLAGHSRCAR